VQTFLAEMVHLRDTGCNGSEISVPPKYGMRGTYECRSKSCTSGIRRVIEGRRIFGVPRQGSMTRRKPCGPTYEFNGDRGVGQHFSAYMDVWLRTRRQHKGRRNESKVVILS
jgi:hypothetical protein